MKPTLLDVIQQRYACHEFIADRPVSMDELAVVLEAGRLAPSAFGLEPWRFISVTEASGKAAITHACFDQPAATTAAAFIAIVALVDDLDPDSDYVRDRFEAEARGGDTAPIYDAYRALLPRRCHYGLGAGPVQLCRGADAAAGGASGARQLPARRVRRGCAGRRLEAAARRNARAGDRAGALQLPCAGTAAQAAGLIRFKRLGNPDPRRVAQAVPGLKIPPCPNLNRCASTTALPACPRPIIRASARPRSPIPIWCATARKRCACSIWTRAKSPAPR